MKRMQDGVMMVENNNTRMAILTTYDKLNIYSKEVKKNVEDFKQEDVMNFLKIYYSNKSKTTIANAISNLKYLYSCVDSNIMNNISLYTAYEHLAIKKNVYFTPEEIYCIVEEIPNFQDKALVLLCYLGLYDTHYKTIQHLKEKNIHKTYIEVNDKEIHITEFVSNIFEKAKQEIENISYTTGKTYHLKSHNGYFLRNKKSNKVEQEIMSVTCLKRKLQQIGEYLGIEEFTAINIKNSRTIYDLVKIEYQLNDGMDINSILLKNYLKDNNTKGCLELLNVDKKNLKDKILLNIIQKKDFFI